MYIPSIFLNRCFSRLLFFHCLLWTIYLLLLLFLFFFALVVLGYSSCVASRGIVERFQEHE